jgi:hypothetical protein
MYFRTAYLLAALAPFLLAGSLGAATINWGLATNIVDDNDISTNGTLVRAYNLGGGDVTVNTVAFTGNSDAAVSGVYSVTDAHIVTPVPNSNNILYVAGRGPGGSFAGGTGYASLLDSTAYAAGANANGGGNNKYAFQLTNLTIGGVYQLQIWFNDSRSTSTNRRGMVDGIMVDYNTGTSNSGVSTGGATGQYLIGEFTADAATQSFDFVGSGGESVGAQLNGYQLRLIPEPSITLLGGLGFAIAAARRRRS